ncbi:MAG: acyl-CoA dehydratase activase [Thermodesulfobacteriota bacterium]
MITVGIDVGSITTKAVVLRDGSILSEKITATGYQAQAAAETVLAGVLSEAKLKSAEVDAVVATGYGRNRVSFAGRAVTEISCHAAGASFLSPGIRSVIDIGGQDSKVVVMDANGRVKDFAMNDKCAAGTGRFLEVMAGALDLDLNDFGPISLTSKAPAAISSLCTVFAESEVISLISKGARRQDIIAGIHAAIAARVTAMAGRIGLTAPVMMTGGVAKNIGVVKAIEARIGSPVEVSPKAQLTGAVGAALIAARGSM